MKLLPKKLAGLLIPVFAMRRHGDLGIGDTKAVLQAIDFCDSHRFRVLQILPIHDTVGDHSPYNPISSRALSPALLTLEPEWVPGLSLEMLERLAPASWRQQLAEGPVKHLSVHSLKLQILMEACRSFAADPEPGLSDELKQFEAEERSWLASYTLYRLLVAEYEGNPHWEEWRPEHQAYPSAEAWLAAHPERDRLEQLRQGHAFVQWVARRQWTRVRQHADAKGIQIMGEISFGVSKASADVWAHPELFDRDWSMGTRPVAYFDTNKDSERWGQNWGLPPYRWENHRSDGFKWLRGRVESEARYFHICRLDHLRGYFRAYMFPWQGGAQHTEFVTLSEEQVLERTGGRDPRFVPGPDEEEITAQMNDLQGREIILVMQEAAGEMALFAEIMGAMPDYMMRALEELQMPNLTFPLLERGDDGSLRDPSSFRRLSLIAFGNHDHAPLAASYAQMREGAASDSAGTGARDLRNLLKFANWAGEPPDLMTSELLSALQRALFETHCQLAVLMSSDLLGSSQRFNLPGSYGVHTWCERLELPFPELERHPVFGPRIQEAQRWVMATERD
jgi:4-alpha-glucanotransferase